jgi:GDP-mannose pyrophosphatase NudK
LELEFDEACDMVANGQIKDCKTIMLLQYAQIHRLLES